MSFLLSFIMSLLHGESHKDHENIYKNILRCWVQCVHVMEWFLIELFQYQYRYRKLATKSGKTWTLAHSQLQEYKLINITVNYECKLSNFQSNYIIK